MVSVSLGFCSCFSLNFSLGEAAPTSAAMRTSCPDDPAGTELRKTDGTARIWIIASPVLPHQGWELQSKEGLLLT